LEGKEQMDQDLHGYSIPTKIIDSDHERVRDFASKVTAGIVEPLEIAVRLYYAVRDTIRYDPYAPFYLPEHYRASYVLARSRSFCVPKASLLCALTRACGIPSRPGFAIVRNHLATRQLLEFMGSDLFVWHGFVELYLNGKWVKATPAFNRELCERHHVLPLEFNGIEDSLFQPYNLENRQFMEYVGLLGTYEDIPVDQIVAGWCEAYGEDRVMNWIRAFEERGDGIYREFDKEEVWDR
jgi:transglutaminase-like putative cysteine protease